MDPRQEISEFLRSRRARISPEAADFGRTANRRVPGLRRDEVAFLAGVSIDYYKRIERGALGGASPEVVERIAEALRLDEAETAYLYDLARAARRNPTTGGPAAEPRLRSGVTRILDSIVEAPASVRNARLDMLGVNALGRAFYSEILESDIAHGNSARFTFLDPRARDFYPDWEESADHIVAALRGNAARATGDQGLSHLIGELAARSEEFSTRWDAHDVMFHRTGRKLFNHPVVGELELDFEMLDLPTDPGLSLLLYFAERNSASAERLLLLESRHM